MNKIPLNDKSCLFPQKQIYRIHLLHTNTASKAPRIDKKPLKTIRATWDPRRLGGWISVMRQVAWYVVETKGPKFTWEMEPHVSWVEANGVPLVILSEIVVAAFTPIPWNTEGKEVIGTSTSWLFSSFGHHHLITILFGYIPRFLSPSISEKSRTEISKKKAWKQRQNWTENTKNLLRCHSAHVPKVTQIFYQ